MFKIIIAAWILSQCTVLAALYVHYTVVTKGTKDELEVLSGTE
jgi:hypothetical protein